MLLSSINFDELEDRTSQSRWGIGTDRDRRLYYGDNRWFKIWGEKYIAATVASVGSEFKKIPELHTLHGFQVGIFNDDIASAFVEFIVDAEGITRGYVSKDGPTLESEPNSQFVNAVYDACMRAGWIYSDFCRSNLIEVDGKLSLIDFDTHLVNIDKFDVEFEKKRGALRSHIVPLFRSKLLERFCAD